MRLLLPMLIACTAPSATPMPQAPLPALFSLSTSTLVAEPGDTLTLDIAMPVPPAPSRIPVYLPRTDGQAGAICHPVLNGGCLDITGQLSLEGPIRTQGGVASFTWRVPANTTDERVQFQALVLTPSGPVASNPVTIVIEPPNAVRSSLYPQDWTPDTTDASGRFLHDFSYAGYHQGEEPLPDVAGPLFDITDHGAVAGDTGDQTASIQAAIDAAEVSGGVVFVPAGTYRIDDQLFVEASGVVIRGVGADSLLHFTRTAGMSDKGHLHIRGRRTWGPEIPAVTDLVVRDSEVEVVDATGLAVGDDIDVGWLISPEFIDDHNMTGVWGPFNNTWQTFFQRRIVDIVDNGPTTTLVLDAPHRYVGKVRDGLSVRTRSGYLTEVGLEDFAITNAQGVAEAQANDRNHAIRMDDVADAWVRNVRSAHWLGEADGQVQSGGLKVYRSKNVTVTDTRFERAQNRGEGGNGYLVEVSQVSDVLLERVDTAFGRHNLIQNWGFGATGIVWKDCTSRDSRAFWGTAAWQWLPAYSEFHHSLATANLIEGGTLDDGWKAENRGTYSSGAGFSAAQNVFWNVGGSGTITSQQWGWGYVVGPAASLDVVTTNLLGVVIGAPEDMVERFGPQDVLQPRSLYDDQLARRLAP